MAETDLQNAKRRAAARELAERIVRLGRNGLGRAEIAAEVGIGLAELARRERCSPRLAGALARAADAERAWWEAQPREALAAGARLNMGAWREAMRWRFGDAAAGAAAASDGPAEPERPRTIYLLPDNGMERGPDGRPLSLEERRARTIAPVTGRIAQLERQLAEWRETLKEVERWCDEYEDDPPEDWDEADDDPDGDDPDEDDPDGEDRSEDDWSEDDWSEDDRNGDGDGPDRDEPREAGADGGAEDEEDETDDDEDERGRDGAGAEPGGCGAGAGADAWFPGLSARCERAVPAGGAGPAAGAAQPAVGAGGARHPQGLPGL